MVELYTFDIYSIYAAYTVVNGVGKIKKAPLAESLYSF